MNCQEIQLQLSGYLEKSLDAIRMKSIETHLASCPFCRAELHGLADCIKWVAALPTVEPPPGFSQRVMAQAREMTPAAGYWQRFFAPLRLPVPVQAAAVVLVSVLAVLLYQSAPQPDNPGFVQEITSAPVLPSQAEQTQAEQKNQFPAENTFAPAERAAPSSAGITPKEIARADTPSRIAKARQQSAPDSESSKQEDVAAQSARSTAPETATEAPFDRRVAAPRQPVIQAQEVSTGSEPRRPSTDALGIGAAIGALSRSPFRASPFSAERALSPLSEPNADFEFIVKRRPRLRTENFAASPDANTVAAEARQRAGAAAPMTGQVVEIRWFTVAPEHYGQFRKDLAAEAIIDTEKSLSPREQDFGLKPPREFLIKVTILPADK